jgi:hypothetical protein
MKKVFLIFVLFFVMSVSAFGESDMTITSLGRATADRISQIDKVLSLLLDKPRPSEFELKTIVKLSEARKQLVDSYIQVLGMSLIGKAQMSMPPR